MRERHVKVRGRQFIVKSDEEGPRVIYERRLYMPGTYMELVYNKPYWHRNHPRPSKLVREILEKLK